MKRRIEFIIDWMSDWTYVPTFYGIICKLVLMATRLEPFIESFGSACQTSENLQGFVNPVVDTILSIELAAPSVGEWLSNILASTGVATAFSRRRGVVFVSIVSRLTIQSAAFY